MWPGKSCISNLRRFVVGRLSRDMVFISGKKSADSTKAESGGRGGNGSIRVVLAVSSNRTVILQHCRLGDRKGIWPVKETGCWFVGSDDLTGALHDS